MKRLDISDQTAISMPMKNLISIIGAVAIGVWAYFGVTEKLNNHSTKLLMILAISSSFGLLILSIRSDLLISVIEFDIVAPLLT